MHCGGPSEGTGETYGSARKDSWLGARGCREAKVGMMLLIAGSGNQALCQCRPHTHPRDRWFQHYLATGKFGMIKRPIGALAIVDRNSIARYGSEIRTTLNQPELRKLASRASFFRTFLALWLTCSCAVFADPPVPTGQGSGDGDQSLKDAVSESKSSGPGQMSPLGFSLEKNSATSKYVLTPEYKPAGRVQCYRCVRHHAA